MDTEPMRATGIPAFNDCAENVLKTMPSNAKQPQTTGNNRKNANRSLPRGFVANPGLRAGCEKCPERIPLSPP